MNINFPLLKTFEVDASITEFLNQKFEEYSSINSSNDNHHTAFTNESYNSGYQTGNLLNWEDAEYQKFIKGELFDLVSENLCLDKNKIEYFWNHMLDYHVGGKMDYHRHDQNEDFVIFIYLKTCSSGDTVFYLNDYCQEYVDRTTVRITPKKNLGVCFSSIVLHKGEITEQNKRIFVCGIRINL
jgi:hypothetical protein